MKMIIIYLPLCCSKPAYDFISSVENKKGNYLSFSEDICEWNTEKELTLFMTLLCFVVDLNAPASFYCNYVDKCNQYILQNACFHDRM